MKTAIDSSVLLLLLRRQPGWEIWRDALTQASTEGPLVICPIVFAECAAGFKSSDEAVNQFDALQIYYDAIEEKSAWLAGQTFLKYRREGGPRDYLIPDFLIAAHAKLQADRLAAIDRGYLRAYFPDLKRVEAGSDMQTGA